MILRLCYVFLCFLSLVVAQTTTNAAGQTIVQTVTSDPVLGPVTRTLSTTLAQGQGPITLDAGDAADGRQGGPVGAPPATSGTPGGPTPYTYRTEVNGRTVSVVDIFTPTRAATRDVTIPATGSVMNFDDYLTRFATATSSATPLLPSLIVSITTSLLAAMFVVLRQ
ncbi:hypothetical protein EST38_g8014 [Candolleomyces aberdarensis]|uniref:Uncharacterized protein n=1 Tax=Candolleomyces aberdarensis TaxID=2316362 RepID=A0A4Q2DFG1_9AGAR|nr:hypothetical protein EST38_g8014 [Candolleomyces aberdarensis]